MKRSDITKGSKIPEEALDYLDSIIWQYQHSEIPGAEKDLVYISRIVQRYINKTAALKTIDKVIETYLDKRRSGHEVGNFKDLEKREKKMRSRGILLDADGLKKRLEQYLLK